LSNILATPYIGGLTPAATQTQALETVEQVLEIVRSRLPHYAVNAEFASRLKRLSAG